MEDIPFDLNEQGFDRMVVEGAITDQVKRHEVRLTKTTSFFEDEKPPAISGALVTISNGVDSWSLAEDTSDLGLYYTPDSAYGTPGLHHDLTIIYDGETFVATDYMPTVAAIDSIHVAFVPDEEGDGGFWPVDISFTEPAGEGDLYRWRVLINGVSDNDSIKFVRVLDDFLLDGSTLTDFRVDGFPEEYIEVGDTITVEQLSLSQVHFDFIEAIQEQTQDQGGLFSPPPANIPTNISGSALGFFSASAVSDKTVIVE